tara:strand:+ start:193 stop:417 length:225 start_codon:yes stop_codon:yes gene_type:complete
MNKIKLILIISIIPGLYSYSQCAMCRVVAESSQNGGDTIANGLNTGILYLMLFPYLLILYVIISSYFRKTTNTN